MHACCSAGDHDPATQPSTTAQSMRTLHSAALLTTAPDSSRAPGRGLTGLTKECLPASALSNAVAAAVLVACARTRPDAAWSSAERRTPPDTSLQPRAHGSAPCKDISAGGGGAGGCACGARSGCAAQSRCRPRVQCIVFISASRRPATANSRQASFVQKSRSVLTSRFLWAPIAPVLRVECASRCGYGSRRAHQRGQRLSRALAGWLLPAYAALRRRIPRIASDSLRLRPL